MINPLQPQTYAERLIEVTKEYTLRPKKGDRARVCIATLQYLLDNFAYNHETCDEEDCGYSGRYVDADDINHLIYELTKLK
jgi:hypothetical protein